ncbi:MAG: hypothetical protein LBN11_02075, partial [Tannerella sp.]|nr:hypothetical protein [Tannerella sp.]
MKRIVFFFTIILASCTTMQDKELSSVERLDVTSQNEFYTGNRFPLQPAQFIKLPVGNIEPEGWLLQQLTLQKEGLNG